MVAEVCRPILARSNTSRRERRTAFLRVASARCVRRRTTDGGEEVVPMPATSRDRVETPKVRTVEEKRHVRKCLSRNPARNRVFGQLDGHREYKLHVPIKTYRRQCWTSHFLMRPLSENDRKVFRMRRRWKLLQKHPTPFPPPARAKKRSGRAECPRYHAPPFSPLLPHHTVIHPPFGLFCIN